MQPAGLTLCVQKEAKIAALVEQDDQMERDKAQVVRQFEQNKDAVIEMLLDKITNISLEVPKVVIQNFDEVQ